MSPGDVRKSPPAVASAVLSVLYHVRPAAPRVAWRRPAAGGKRSLMENVPGSRKQGLYDPQVEHDACGLGFVVDAHGRKSHDIVRQAIQVLLNLEHRGACGCEKNTGDGAGILMQMPHEFLAEECEKLGITLPRRGQYAVSNLFLPTAEADRRRLEE